MPHLSVVSCTVFVCVSKVLLKESMEILSAMLLNIYPAYYTADMTNNILHEDVKLLELPNNDPFHNQNAGISILMGSQTK